MRTPRLVAGVRGQHKLGECSKTKVWRQSEAHDKYREEWEKLVTRGKPRIKKTNRREPTADLGTQGDVKETQEEGDMPPCPPWVWEKRL